MELLSLARSARKSKWRSQPTICRLALEQHVCFLLVSQSLFSWANSCQQIFLYRHVWGSCWNTRLKFLCPSQWHLISSRAAGALQSTSQSFQFGWTPDSEWNLKIYAGARLTENNSNCSWSCRPKLSWQFWRHGVVRFGFCRAIGGKYCQEARYLPWCKTFWFRNWKACACDSNLCSLHQLETELSLHSTWQPEFCQWLQTSTSSLEMRNIRIPAAFLASSQELGCIIYFARSAPSSQRKGNGLTIQKSLRGLFQSGRLRI